MSDKRLIDANALLGQNNWSIKQYSEQEADAWRDGIALMKKNIENAPPSTQKRCDRWHTGRKFQAMLVWLFINVCLVVCTAVVMGWK